MKSSELPLNKLQASDNCKVAISNTYWQASLRQLQRSFYIKNKLMKFLIAVSQCITPFPQPQPYKTSAVLVTEMLGIIHGHMNEIFFKFKRSALN